MANLANNRLYIVDTETGEKFMLAKTLGYGWYCRGTNPGEPLIDERLESWADLRDMEASYGNCFDGVTKLILVCENDLEFDRHLTMRAPDRLQRSLLWRFAKFLLYWDARLARIGGR